MSQIESVPIPTVDSLVLSVIAPNRVRLQGTITNQEPAKALGGCFKSIHEAALADHLSVVELDVTELKFVNSSAIRLFLDWAGWVKTTPNGGYKLHILTTRKFTWQKTSFTAITALAKGSVELKPAD